MSVQTYTKILAELQVKADNAIDRNKPTMWAYFIDMKGGLESWFVGVVVDDGGYAGAALALSQKAARECPHLEPQAAARLWAMSVYARRILSAWSGRQERVSLNWLRARRSTERNPLCPTKPTTRDP